MVTITYSHHSLIQGNRNGALLGAIFTVFLAMIFTAFQGVEYSVSSFTISDGAYGSCFYFGTGLIPAPTINRRYIKSNNRFYSQNGNDLHPYWVTGFCDAESSFSIRVAKDEKRFKSLRIAPIFSIELHEKDYNLLLSIQTHFQVGTIIKRVRKGRPSAIYSVQSIKALKEVIIPHFNNSPLLTQKREDFRLFCLVVNLIYNKQDKSEQGLNEILSYKASLKKGLSGTLKHLFPHIMPAARNTVAAVEIFDPFWIAGFVDGEGCFYVKVSGYKEGKKVNVYFSVAQDIRDKDLLKNLAIYLNCGLIETVRTRPSQSTYVVYKFHDIMEKIIPFFNTYSLKGVKALDFADFKKIANIVENTSKTGNMSYRISEIIEIKSNMNRNR